LVYNYTSSASPAITNFTNLADGTYYLNATANDSAGNINQTETRVFVLDDTLPQVSFLPDTMASGNYSRTWIYANVSVSDLHFDKVVVRLYNSSGSLINNFTSSSAVFAANFSSLSDGTYYLNATANDTFGNANISEKRTITLDTLVPFVSFVSPTSM
jgi:hypothetical protein